MNDIVPVKKDGKSNLTPGGGGGKVEKKRRTTLVRDAIALAAERLGGADRLVAWVREDPINERLFWTQIYPKLLPVQITGEGGEPVRLTLVGSDING